MATENTENIQVQLATENTDISISGAVESLHSSGITREAPAVRWRTRLLSLWKQRKQAEFSHRAKTNSVLSVYSVAIFQSLKIPGRIECEDEV